MAKLPTRLEDLLPVAAFEKVVDLLHRPELSGKVRDALGKVGLQEVNPLEQVQAAWQQARGWLGSLGGEAIRQGESPINATGRLFDEQTDRVPMATAVSLALARAMSGFHDRQSCLSKAGDVVQRCLGARSHVWFHDPLVAVQLAARQLAPQGVVMARSDSVRIAGLGNAHALLSAWGGSVTEVGASNGASEADWNTALSQSPSRLVVLVSPNNLTSEQAAHQRRQAIDAAQRHQARVLELLADGCCHAPLAEQYGFPLISERMSSGVNVVLVPTHLLWGGVRGMLCLGEEACLGPVGGAMAPLGAELDCAGIMANLLALQLGGLSEELDQGTVGALQLNPENLRNRCQRLAIQLAGLGPIATAELIESQHALGVSPWNRYQLHNCVVRLGLQGDSRAIYESLRRGSAEIPAILTWIEGPRLLVDLRFVHPDDDHQIVKAANQLAA